VSTRSSAGQASAEYVALLLVAATLLTVAGAALTLPDLRHSITHAVRTAICIAGGDVCRTAEAKAAGLPPCVTSERSTRQETTLDIAVFRLGEHGEWQLALASDGSATVTRLEEREAGGTAGVGVAFSPAGVEAQARATLSAGYRSGGLWRFADAAGAAAWLEAARRTGTVPDGRLPDVRWDAFTAQGQAAADVALADLASAGVRGGADGALGLRREGGRRTLTLALASDAATLMVELLEAPFVLAPPRSVVADVTWEDGTVRDIAVRAATQEGERTEELTARLDLRDATSRALVTRVLTPGGSPRDELRALAERVGTHGTVERAGYVTTEQRSGISIAGRLGVAIGFSDEQVTSERRLVDAVTRIRGGPLQRRFDCLGV